MHLIFLIVFAIAGICFSACDTQDAEAEKHAGDFDHLKPVFVDAEAGREWNIFGLQIVGKIMSHETNGQYAVVISNTPPDGGPPPHVHEHEDELFYVLEGQYEFTCGNEIMQASPGALVYLPRNLPHSFRNVGDTKGVLINTITPGGFEAFFEEIDQLPKDKPLDRQRVTTIGLKYGLKFLPVKQG